MNRILVIATLNLMGEKVALRGRDYADPRIIYEQEWFTEGTSWSSISLLIVASRSSFQILRSNSSHRTEGQILEENVFDELCYHPSALLWNLQYVITCGGEVF